MYELIGNGSLPILGFSAISPSAGTDAIWTVTTGKIWAPLACVVKLSTSGTAATREVLLWITNATTDAATEAICEVVPYTTQAASIGRSYEWSLGLGYEKSASQANTGHMSMPEVYIDEGYKIRTKVLNIQAGDSWSAAWLYYLEYTK